MKHLSYADRFTAWLKRNLARGVKTFSHRDILLVTGTNCSYSVLQDLRLRFDLKESRVEKLSKTLDIKGNEVLTKKIFKEYEVLAEKC